MGNNQSSWSAPWARERRGNDQNGLLEFPGSPARWEHPKWHSPPDDVPIRRCSNELRTCGWHSVTVYKRFCSGSQKKTRNISSLDCCCHGHSRSSRLVIWTVLICEVPASRVWTVVKPAEEEKLHCMVFSTYQNRGIVLAKRWNVKNRNLPSAC